MSRAPAAVVDGEGGENDSCHNQETGESYRFTCPITSSQLHHASMNGDVSVVKRLLRTGADVNMIFKTVPPIYIAAMFNRCGVIRVLIDARCDVNAKTIELGQTALHCAVSKNFLDVCKLLCANGANVNQRDCDGVTAVMLAATTADEMGVLQYLIDSCDADTNMADNRGLTPLAAAVQNANVAAVQVLLRSGTVLDVRDNHGNTELFHAVKGGQTEICRALVRAGANVNVRNKNNEYPISVAAMYGNSSITDILIHGGCDVNVVSHVGTPLYAAVERQHVNVLRMLIDAGADAALTPPIFRFVLTEALHQHVPNRDIILALMRAGCNIDSALCECHDSPITMVISKSNMPLVFLMIQLDAKAGTITAAKMDEIRQYCPYTYKYLVEYESRKVNSLKALSRKAIKRACGTVHYSRRVDSLPMPTVMKQYLLHYDVTLPKPEEFECPDALAVGSRFRKAMVMSPVAAALSSVGVRPPFKMAPAASPTAVAPAASSVTSRRLNTKL